MIIMHNIYPCTPDREKMQNILLVNMKTQAAKAALQGGEDTPDRDKMQNVLLVNMRPQAAEAVLQGGEDAKDGREVHPLARGNVGQVVVVCSLHSTAYKII